MKATYILPCLLSLNALFKVLYPAVQHIVSVGVGHASKSVCSGVFLSNRAAQSVEENELQGITALLIVPKVNYTDQTVTSTFLGVSKEISEALSLRIGTAKYLGPAFGCSLTMETFKKSPEFYNFEKMHSFVTEDVNTGSKESSLSSETSCDVTNESQGSCETDLLPSINSDHLNIDCFNSVLDTEFGKEGFLQNQTRALVVSHDSQIIAERYQHLLDITPETRLLGWSMTKSVFSAIIGVAIQQGLLTLDTPAKLKQLKPSQREKLIEKNNGKVITFRHLLQMYDILGFVEDYSPMKDVVFMLYGTYETVKFSTSRQTFSDANRFPGEGWYYSSAVSNLLSEELRGLFDSDAEYWEFPHKFLFSKIGAHSFAIEMDARGIFVASSFGYASARDWTKLGEVLLNRGRHNGQQIIDPEFLEFATKPHPRSAGHYGAHFWLNPAIASSSEDALLPDDHR